jgi:hypothetical protein
MTTKARSPKTTCDSANPAAAFGGRVVVVVVVVVVVSVVAVADVVVVDVSAAVAGGSVVSAAGWVVSAGPVFPVHDVRMRRAIRAIRRMRGSVHRIRACAGVEESDVIALVKEARRLPGVQEYR